MNNLSDKKAVSVKQLPVLAKMLVKTKQLPVLVQLSVLLSLLIVLTIPSIIKPQVKIQGTTTIGSVSYTNAEDDSTIKRTAGNKLYVDTTLIYTKSKAQTDWRSDINASNGRVSFGISSTGLGNSAYFLWDNSNNGLTVGSSSGTIGSKSLRVGTSMSATSRGAVAIGNGAYAGKRKLGKHNGKYYYTDGYETFAHGLTTYATGDQAVAFNSGSRADGILASAFGSQTYAYGNDSQAEGIATQTGRRRFSVIASGTGPNYVEISGDYQTFFQDTTDTTESPTNHRFWTYNTLIIGSSSGSTYSSVGWNQRNIDSTALVGGNTRIYYDSTAVSSPWIVLATYKITRDGNGMHVEGIGSNSAGYAAHAEGYETNVWGYAAHSEGFKSDATGNYAAHAEGYNTTASGDYGAHSEGEGTTASGRSAHAEGRNTMASGNYSHSGGYQTTASDLYAVALQYNNTASAEAAMAVGKNNTASGVASFVAGINNVASNDYAAVINNNSTASAKYSFAHGNNSIADHRAQRSIASGKINEKGDAQGCEIVMYGTAPAANYYDLKLGGADFWTVDSNRVIMATAWISAKEVGADSAAVYKVDFGVFRGDAASTTRLINSYTISYSAEDISSWNVRIVAQNGYIYVQGYGEAGTSVNFVARILYTEIKTQ